MMNTEGPITAWDTEWSEKITEVRVARMARDNAAITCAKSAASGDFDAAARHAWRAIADDRNARALDARCAEELDLSWPEPERRCSLPAGHQGEHVNTVGDTWTWD